MGIFDMGKAQVGDMTNTVDDYSIPNQVTDAATDQKETYWDNSNWTKWFGYYRDIPELKAVIDAKATWTIGKGIIADRTTMLILDSIKGWGKDTFNTILENMIRTYQIGGDAFASIVRDEELNLVNLKPLDPSKIRIVADRKGMIIRYELITTEKNKKNKPIKKEDLFHLARNRVADEIHGQSMVEPLSNIILAKNEAMDDMRELMHRYVKPKFIFHLDTDVESEIAAIKLKQDKATGQGENIYIPKDAVVPELLAVAPNATLNPLPWIDSLDNKFYEAAGIPKIIIGNSGEFTEASAKIAYLAFQQNIEEEQLFTEEQVGQQLGLEIELEFPASLENELLSDKAKDGELQAAQPNDTTATSGGINEQENTA